MVTSAPVGGSETADAPLKVTAEGRRLLASNAVVASDTMQRFRRILGDDSGGIRGGDLIGRPVSFDSSAAHQYAKRFARVMFPSLRESQRPPAAHDRAAHPCSARLME